MASSQAQLSWPPPSLFGFPPSLEPKPLPPPTETSFKAPLPIPSDIYEGVLSPKVPLTFAFVYMTAVFALNRINKRRKYKPWAISNTYVFHVFVLLHNVLLASYSGVTCVALVRTIQQSFVSPFQDDGVARSLDSLCKMQGPRGFGDAVTFNPSSRTWSSPNSLIRLGANGLPHSTDVGRIWNEGLAFWGWLFYMSKFYEVVDTMVILAKGKRSSTLQTYHHAGAMLSMWAGIRYMSPPIWMFVLVNSAIHTMMYTYYTLSTVGIKVHASLKGLLTTLQILQFIVGVLFATPHIFVSYSIPVTIPVKIATAVPSAVRAASSAVEGAISPEELSSSAKSVSLMAISTAMDPLPFLKKLAMYAVGAQDLELDPSETQTQHHAASQASTATMLEEIRYRKHYQTIQCLDTSGQAFAIWLNVFYLIPLTVLFAVFFVKSYVLGRPAKRSPQARRISSSAVDAARRTSQTFEDFGKSVEHSMDSLSHEMQEGGADLQLQDDAVDDDQTDGQNDGHQKKLGKEPNEDQNEDRTTDQTTDQVRKDPAESSDHEDSDEQEPIGNSSYIEVPGDGDEDGPKGGQNENNPATGSSAEEPHTGEKKDVADGPGESKDAAEDAESAKNAPNGPVDEGPQKHKPEEAGDGVQPQENAVEDQDRNAVTDGAIHEHPQDGKPAEPGDDADAHDEAVEEPQGGKPLSNGASKDESHKPEPHDADDEEVPETAETADEQPGEDLPASDLLHRPNS